MSIDSYHQRYSIDSEQDDDRTKSTCSHCCHWCRIIVVITLICLSIISTTTLCIILYKDKMKEKMLEEKRKGWIQKWNKISPYVKQFPLGFLLGFIRNLIVLAIERQQT